MPSTVSPGWSSAEIGGGVGLRAGVRLDVGVLGAEELFGAGDGEPLDLVHDLAAAVVALARQPLGVFVGHDVGHGLLDRRADVVLGGDQLDAVELAALLAADEVGDLGVFGFEIGHG